MKIDKIGPAPEAVRKNINELATQNANLLFSIANNCDEGTRELLKAYKEIAKTYWKLAETYHEQFLNQVATDGFDKEAAAQLIHKLFCLLTEQNRTIEDCADGLFDEYRRVFDVVTTYLVFVSDEEIDLEKALDHAN